MASMFGGGYGAMPGMGGSTASPSAFASPGLNPMMLALLMQMQNRGAGANAAPGLPPAMNRGTGQPFQPMPPPNVQAQVNAAMTPPTAPAAPKPPTQPANVPSQYVPGQTAPNMYNAPIGPTQGTGNPMAASLQPGYMPAPGGNGGGNILNYLFGQGYNGGYVPSGGGYFNG